MTDNIWKAVSFITALVVFPLFGWVWETNTKVSTIKNDARYTTASLAETKETTKKVEEEQHDMETDIRLIQQKLDRVEKNTEEVLELMKRNIGN